MHKFFVLLSKEIRELLTVQTILPLLLVAVIFGFMGKVIGSAVKEVSNSQSVSIIDQDNTSTSDAISTTLEKSGFKVKNYSDSLDSTIAQTEANNGTAVLVIPRGFTSGLATLSPKPIQTYTIMRNFSATGTVGATIITSALSSLNDYFSNQYITSKHIGNPATIKNPLTTVSYVQIGNRRAMADPTALSSFVTQQITFIPIILFFIILFAAQIIATTMATEKENKTLETLLTLPISRRSIIMAKMLAAGIVAALSSLVYMLGYKYYLGSITGDQSSSSIHAVASQLGLVFTPLNYLVLGISLFIAILVALAIALILGAFAEDVKSVQSLIMPLMILIMIPYILTLLLDVSAASLPVRILVYAIPFSHAFLTAPNLFLHNYSAIAWGIGYELVWFLIFIAIATHIFSTDQIVTMKLNWGKRKR